MEVGTSSNDFARLARQAGSAGRPAPRAAGRAGAVRCWSVGSGGAQGEVELEARAAVDCARDVDPSMVGLDDPLDQSEAETGAAARATPGLVGAEQAIEDIGNVRLRDADP